MRNRRYIKFLWSHDLAIHRYLVRIYNAFIRYIPFSIKYGLGLRLREKRFPYCLIKPGSVIVQVGAPRDTLLAGRSRGMYFSLLAGSNGKVFIIEPDIESATSFEKMLQARGLTNTIVCQFAAWNEKGVLQIYVNDRHPASSFTEGTKSYTGHRLSEFRAVEMQANTIDERVKQSGVEQVDLVSITTNGAERKILAGMRDLISSGLSYIALADTGEAYANMMEEFGYKLLAHDDRGFTFERKKDTYSNT
jgi:FkbM family methyltransferase